MNIIKYHLEKRKALKEAEEYRKKNFHNTPANFDTLLANAAIAIIDHNKASIGLIMRILAISFSRAEIIMCQLEQIGIVGEENGVYHRDILVKNKVDALALINAFCNHSFAPPIDYDAMKGHDFEYYCADLLRKIGFINVEVTQGSGDHGIDILAEKDDITYAIQCKCYSSNIGNTAIQQAHTGKSLYHRDVAVVMTNQYFTQQAKEEAVTLGVKLWDRDKLNALINKSML